MSASFKHKLESGQPVVTVELSPPRGTDVSLLLKHAAALKGLVDAINVPDCQLSILKMSSMAACKLIEDATGIETVWQMTCRDRNLIALQADLLGGYALGLRNLLTLTGDPVQLGDQRDYAKQVFHLESVRLLELVSGLNRGMDATGRDLKSQGTDFTVGAALNPFRLSSRPQQLRMRQKIEHGVQFFQTQPVYSREPIEQMYEVLAQVAEETGRPAPRALVGIIPPKNAEAARRMNRHVVGVAIPESFIEILERAQDPLKESFRFCADVVASMDGLADGFHFMPVGLGGKVPELLTACFPPSMMMVVSESVADNLPADLTTS